MRKIIPRNTRKHKKTQKTNTPKESLAQLPDFVKLKYAEDRVGVSYRLLLRWAQEGKIPAIRSSGNRGTWFVDPEAVREALRNQDV